MLDQTGNIWTCDSKINFQSKDQNPNHRNSIDYSSLAKYYESELG